ncbi:MAG: multiheme c-type cytochrome [Planctomycetota bacterium]|nr:multiheme c-type cytochrome [Planctomycetota bacterium]
MKVSPSVVVYTTLVAAALAASLGCPAPREKSASSGDATQPPAVDSSDSTDNNAGHVVANSEPPPTVLQQSHTEPDAPPPLLGADAAPQVPALLPAVETDPAFTEPVSSALSATKAVTTPEPTATEPLQVAQAEEPAKTTIKIAAPRDAASGADAVNPAEAKNSQLPISLQPRKHSHGPTRAPPRNADGSYGKSRVDPVKLNGPVFLDEPGKAWPVPQAALVFTGALEGYIEPCGCAGLENQKGGMSRRHQLIKEMQAKKWPVAAFDVGGLIKRFGRQQELKYASSVEALKKMGYQGIGFGPDDLRLPVDRLVESAAAVTDAGSPFIATNVALYSFEDALVERYKVVKVGNLKIGVMAVIGDEDQKKVRNDEIKFVPAATAVAKVLPELKKAGCDKLILLAYSNLREAIDLGKQFPELDVVVTTGGTDEPPDHATPIGEKTQIVQVGHKGMYCVVIGLYDDNEIPQRYQRVPLDVRFGESKEMELVLSDYQNVLQTEGLAGLGVRALPHSSGQKFVGSAACADCHTEAYKVWQNSGHAHATKTLTDLRPQRHFDPECLSCHVTGWDPQRYFPFNSGYLDLKKTPHLMENGCENCHGPGGGHVAAELGTVEVSDAKLQALRTGMRLTLEAANAKCIECHDGDNSPDYKFKTYWPLIEHKGKD